VAPSRDYTNSLFPNIKVNKKLSYRQQITRNLNSTQSLVANNRKYRKTVISARKVTNINFRGGGFRGVKAYGTQVVAEE